MLLQRLRGDLAKLLLQRFADAHRVHDDAWRQANMVQSAFRHDVRQKQISTQMWENNTEATWMEMGSKREEKGERSERKQEGSAQKQQV